MIARTWRKGTPLLGGMTVLLVNSSAVSAQAVGPRSSPVLALHGYVQGRYTNPGTAAGEHGRAGFQITRVRPTVTLTLGGNLKAVLQGNLTSQGVSSKRVSARDLYVQYARRGFQLRIGQSKVPFGYEVYQEGDEERPALERARVFAVLFPDERDVGLVLSAASRTAPADGPAYAVGILNGAGINRWSGSTAGRNVAARVLVPLRRAGVAGASVYTGNSPGESGAPTLKRVAGIEYRKKLGRLGTAAEYAVACLGRKDVYGGYAQATYRVGRSGTVFARHDIYDPDRQAGAADRWNRTAVGGLRDWGYLRATVEYDFVRERGVSARSDTFGAQLQFRF